METKRSAVSFSFSKVRQTNAVVKHKPDETDSTENKDVDFLLSVEGKELKSTKPVEEKKELVIPLIGTNKWRIPEKQQGKEVGRNNDKQEKKPIVEEDIEAIKEILEDAAREKERWEDRDKDPGASERVVPLLMQNKIPEGFETDDKLDVTLRPNEPEEADYAEIPIEHFGVAMLRGMGWKEVMNNANDKDQKPVEVMARPKGLGLGADRSKTLQASYQGDKKEGDEEEDLVLCKGAYCVVTSGKLKDLYAEIVGIDEDNCRVIVQMTLSGDKVTLSQFAVKLVNKKEYKTYSKYLNKGKSEKYKEDEAKRNEKQNHRSSQNESESSDSEYSDSDSKHRKKSSKHKYDKRDKYRSHYDDKRDRGGSDYDDKRDRHRSDYNDKRDRGGSDYDDKRDRRRSDYDDRREIYRESKSDKYRDSDYKSTPERDSKKRKHRDYNGREDYSDSEDKYYSKKSSKSKRRSPSRELSPVNGEKAMNLADIWIRSHLRVRIVDKKYKKGKYYKSKVIVEDVISGDSCICRTEEGKVLEDICQNQLETVIPRSEPAYIMVVSGKYKTKVAEVLKRDKESCTATIQLLNDRDIVLETGYDMICEYTGDVTHEMDY